MTLQLKSVGPAVVEWQKFLIKLQILNDIADGIFGPKTLGATQIFQRNYNLDVTGIVESQTLTKAKENGYGNQPAIPPSIVSNEWVPPMPDFKPLVSNSDRQKNFGAFAYKLVDQNGGIVVTDNWRKDNIITIEIPQLKGVNGAPQNCLIPFHKKGAEQLKAMFAAWETEGLIKKILGWAGSYAPRMVRGTTDTLSNHAFGTAFDINVPWNALGAVPTKTGKKGSVQELVPIANQHGFFWGGHYGGRKDGMHFEIAKII